MDDIRIAKAFNEIIDGKFSLGDKSQGWDCLNSMADFFRKMGVDFPSEFMGWTWENYAERWARKMDFIIFKKFLLSIGKPVDLCSILPGDIIILEKGEYISAGLYMGNGLFRAVSNPHGVLRLPIRFFESSIIGVRRLIDHGKSKAS